MIPSATYGLLASDRKLHRTPSVAGETPRQRRGDIHSSLSFTPSRRPRQAVPRAPGSGLNDDLNSDGTHLSIPASSAPDLSIPAEPTDEPDEIRAIWGTTVNLEETMNTFKEFLRGFKVKYRVAHDRERGLRTRAMSSPAEGEEILYESYLRTMRRTGQNNLNLDMVNLLAYPPSRKLHGQLVKYPQEVVPAMDTALKDVMSELLEEDRLNGDVELQGEEGDREMANINTGVFKIRPFGLPAVNLRDLNPTGQSITRLFATYLLNHILHFLQIPTNLFVLKASLFEPRQSSLT